jgi:hypothetical protein
VERVRYQNRMMVLNYSLYPREIQMNDKKHDRQHRYGVGYKNGIIVFSAPRDNCKNKRPPTNSPRIGTTNKG